MVCPPLRNSALQEMAGKVDELPLLPQVLVRLLQISPLADDYFEQFEKLVAEDPSFAVRVIGAANSAASAPVSPITTIREAMTRVGASTLGDLVASLSVQRVFMPREPAQVRLWTHSLGVAVAARALAPLMPKLGVKPGEAYLAGLLHDIGRFVMLEHASDELRAVDESNWATPEALIEADLAIYTYTHAELGYLACQNWGLPEVLSAVVQAHHEPFSEALSPGTMDALRYVVQMADFLSVFVLENLDTQQLEGADLVRQIAEHCLPEVPRQQPITAELVAQHAGRMHDEARDVAASLGFQYG